jgi:class 3 adenylate cyclase
VQPELPTGTVTFLFTDIEGSTRLLRELGGEDYAAELARHQELLRDVFGRHGGVEVDTQGDAFFVAFGSARDAVAAAREAQESLAGSLVWVRMGLHTGEALVTGEGYVGMDVHRAARIAAVAHGRQVVLSRATRAVLDADVPVCTMCGRLAPRPSPRSARARLANASSATSSTSARKSRRRRATSHAVRARDSLAWQQARAQARARDSGCVYRSQGGCSGELAVHHLVPLERGRGGTNALPNLVTVCRAHHERVQHG